MNLFTTAEFNLIKADAYRGTFDSTCQISRKPKTFDSKGGNSADWVVIEDDIPCALRDLTVPQQQELAGQEVGIFAKMLLTPFGTDGMEDDQVLLSGVTYKILSPYGDSVYQVFQTFVVQRRSIP